MGYWWAYVCNRGGVTGGCVVCTTGGGGGSRGCNVCGRVGVSWLVSSLLVPPLIDSWWSGLGLRLHILGRAIVGGGVTLS
jgi:hypothetical protein